MTDGVSPTWLKNLVLVFLLRIIGAVMVIIGARLYILLGMTLTSLKVITSGQSS